MPADPDQLSGKTKEAIRHLLYSKASRDEIMETLSMSFRTYLRYVEATREDDAKVLSRDKKSVAWEFKKAYNRLNTIVERWSTIRRSQTRSRWRRSSSSPRPR